LGCQKDKEKVAFLGKAGSMGTLIGLILLIVLIFVQPLETAKLISTLNVLKHKLITQNHDMSSKPYNKGRGAQINPANRFHKHDYGLEPLQPDAKTQYIPVYSDEAVLNLRLAGRVVCVKPATFFFDICGKAKLSLC
jgi:hypothetical protein